MRLYLSAKTGIPDIYIDYIEVILSSGEQVSLNWDYSDICREDDGFCARYKGVYFGEEYANGRLAELKKITIVEVGYYTETEDIPVTIEIEEMDFEDYGENCISEINNDYDLCFTG